MVRSGRAWPKSAALALFLGLTLIASRAQAEINNAGILDNVLQRYSTAAGTWATTISEHASWLFWTLAVISMVWTFGMMALRQADIGEFFAEFVRFTIFTGFFWWLLSNGPQFAVSIMDSLRAIGAKAIGTDATLTPSGIVDIGFEIFFKVLDQSTVWSPVDSAVGILISAVVLVVLALIGVNMLLLLISGWVLAYAGIFFLGFGGSRWTSDMAIAYFKTVLSIAAQLFAMVLLVGIGKSFIDQYYGNMSAGISLKELGVMLIVAVILLVLVNKVPPLIGHMAMGGGTHALGHGAGAGTAIGAVAMGAAVTGMAGAAVTAGAANIAGGAQALMAAYAKASESDSNSGGLGDLMSAASGRNDANSLGPSPWSGGGDDGVKPASSGAGSQEGAPSRGGGLGRAGKIAAGTAVNLGKAAWQVAKTSAGARIDRTTGGRIAGAIKEEAAPSSPTPYFGGDSLSSGQSSGKSEPMDVEKEVTAFVNKDAKS